MINHKNIIIIEGPDATGKSELCNYIQKYVNGKCHILHSNYNKSFLGENNYFQHKNFINFTTKQFSKKYFTGNYTVVFDRCYISDMIYGQLGYGSPGSLDYKYKKLNKLLKKLCKYNDVSITFVYCNLETSLFSKERREELLSNKENSIIFNSYKIFMESKRFQETLKRFKIKFYPFNFKEDPEYNQFTDYINIQ